jgi:hypothetical protein
MVRAFPGFRQTDVTRAVKGARAGGLEIERIEIDARTGNIVISTPRVPSAPVNSYDAWKGESNAR